MPLLVRVTLYTTINTTTLETSNMYYIYICSSISTKSKMYKTSTSTNLLLNVLLLSYSLKSMYD